MVAFLNALNALDTYRLLTLRRVATAVAAGVLAAAACYGINTLGFQHHGGAWAYLGAPAVEEIAKAAFVFYCVARHRVAFPVDAAVTGFAVGTGFALAENVFYLYQLSAAEPLTVWLVRGIGTALMHGGTTAIVAIGTVTLAARNLWIGTPPVLAVAIALHSAYNAGAMPPLERTAVILVTLPVILALTFWRSERTLSRWLHGKLDRDIETMSMIDSGEFLESDRGRYLSALRDCFPAEIVADMLCLVRMSVELSAKSKGDLLRRELGFPPIEDPQRAPMLNEIAFLERNIGVAGRRALTPLLPLSARDQWERSRM